ncbi:sigma-70 family RNA polymerase sigma factor [Actinoplanes friuliensis]|uniref:RNA polymerase factor sigma-70 n=1 Tax=Actinoplanes friuliensis DSM 7358 TaxID=1246995 RepID=U5WDF4_9ACTN|nr:sigma-70 family RNA polymerase sigma factor [Actinoplanes friuliensis]AGZ45981.1 RNA polymerase factor sigma-70 [Actinoplanes friuliensis DSM 7358]
MEEATLLTAAQSGDADAFGRLVGSYRDELLAHCYRMLGSVDDAEDALQESLVRAWRGLGTFRAGSIRPWLYRIATNRCLTLIEQRARRELPADLSPGAPLNEVAWLEPYPDRRLGPAATVEQREGIGLAFVAALQHLSGLQRAVLLLREVLGFSAAEVAGQLDTTVAAVNSGLQRARAVLAQRRPPVTPTDDKIKELADRYASAWQAADVDTIVAMLTDDATYSMPPLPEWYSGRAAIRDFLLSGPLTHRWRFVPAAANGQLAFGTYLWDERRAAYAWAGLDVLRLDGDRIAEVVSFLTPGLQGDFGLPDEVR